MDTIRSYNTFRLDHRVGQVIVVDTVAALREALSQHKDPIILGDGSNVLFTKDTDKVVLVVDIKGIDIDSEDNHHVIINVGAGEVWHDLVMWAIDNGYGGIENLSLIPGKCGAAPMQNIGAYGVELKDVLVSVTCMGRSNGALFNMSRSACKLGYRDSIFKKEYKGQYVITSIKLRLTKAPHHIINTDYGDIKNILSKKEIHQPTIRDISDAVITIRSSKLPDPKYLPNAGSFFKNPVVPVKTYEALKWRFPLMPSYPVSEETCKIPAGWLIDQCGWKGVMVGAAGVHLRQALVIVNHGCKSGGEIVKLSELIQESVMKRYGIELQPEVNFIF